MSELREVISQPFECEAQGLNFILLSKVGPKQFSAQKGGPVREGGGEEGLQAPRSP